MGHGKYHDCEECKKAVDAGNHSEGCNCEEEHGHEDGHHEDGHEHKHVDE